MICFGIDRVEEYRHWLQGRVALITAPSGRTGDNRSSIDRLREVCDLRLLLAPEHGLSASPPHPAADRQSNGHAPSYHSAAPPR